MEIFAEFAVEAAHHLPHVAPDHKCRRLHGHSYRVELHVQGEVDPATGMVMDFAQVRAAFEPVQARLDHRCLNDISGLDNPTSENLARWIWDQVGASLPLRKVVVRETPRTGAVYRGPG